MGGWRGIVIVPRFAAELMHERVTGGAAGYSREGVLGACELTRESPPNLLADYLYLRQTTVAK
jgi:hypothetical protein